jgi:hypothetical protein
MHFGYDSRDNVSDAGDILQPTIGDQILQRLGKGGQAISGPSIGARPIGIAAPQS